MKLILKPFHYSWIERNFSKLASTRKDKKERKLLESLAKKASGDPSYLKINKEQQAVLLQATEISIKALLGAIKKYEKSPLEYEEYTNQAKERLELMESLKEKLKRKA